MLLILTFPNDNSPLTLTSLELCGYDWIQRYFILFGFPSQRQTAFLSPSNVLDMSDQNTNWKANMGNCLPVARDTRRCHSGRCVHDDYDGAQLEELRRIISEVTGPPTVSYPIDDTMPTKTWAYEKKHDSKNDYKPLRPEDEHKALEVLNRHLPFWDQIKTSQPPATVPETAADLKPRLYPETHLPLPPRSGGRRQRPEAARPHGSHQETTTTKSRKVKQAKHARRIRSQNWIQTEDKEEKDANVGEMEENLPVVNVPDLVVTRPDGETRRLRDPNEYTSGK